MEKPHKWQFKARFRKGAYGWRGTSLAAKRLREAVSEIKKAVKSDPVVAVDGAISLMERLWPALEHIDGSSGALGNAVHKTLVDLIPILVEAPADERIRRDWLERLYKAVQEDGVQYLNPVEEKWGKICKFKSLMNEWADRLLPGLKENWANKEYAGYFVGTDICLSCLLEAGRFDELKEMLALKKHHFWGDDKYWAEALRRQGKIDEAIAFAESRQKDGYEKQKIMEFCEQLLLESGRRDEAYDKYGLSIRKGMTYISQFRSIAAKYPEHESRQVLNDLIEKSDDKAAWFASANQEEFLDIARDCAFSGRVDPKTLTRAARDRADSDPKYAAEIALRAIDLLLQGYGYETTTLDVKEAFEYLMRAAKKLQKASWAETQVKSLLDRDPPNKDKISQGVLMQLLEEAENC